MKATDSPHLHRKTRGLRLAQQSTGLGLARDETARSAGKDLRYTVGVERLATEESLVYCTTNALPDTALCHFCKYQSVNATVITIINVARTVAEKV